MRKRFFVVTFENNHEQILTAHRYRREGDQYVFESDGDDDVQFCDATGVLSVQILPPDAFDVRGSGSS